MISILLVVQVILALVIIVLIMLQRGKGADAGAALGGGGGSSGSVFGARGAANFLSRTTAVLAAAFFVNSLALATLSANLTSESSLTGGSVLEATQPASDVPAASSSDVPMAEDVSSPVSDVPAAEK